MQRIRFNLLSVIFLWLVSCCIATAQAPVALSDQITNGDTQEVIQADSSSTGTFETVTVDASANSDVKLQFPASLASKTVTIAAMDGGALTNGGGTSSIGTDGSLLFSFQVSDQPGVHRVMVIDPNADDNSPNIIGLVQFEVPSPAN
jgi:hypothetical protein